MIDKRSIVYLDGSGFCVDAPRDRGYIFSVCLFYCNIDADVFYQCITRELLPNVPHNSVIVLDNATFHKRNDALLAVQQHGHTLEFLPTYSPDLNPIERKWTQAKSIRRKFGYSVQELFMCSHL
ncbi:MULTISPECIES: transposase [unclassified Dysgonomonas]|uniref:transposase n=1 Tax=unclassified Dysgonomonas TaxID=2630389 RepID=UPI0038B3FB10